MSETILAAIDHRLDTLLAGDGELTAEQKAEHDALTAERRKLVSGQGRKVDHDMPHREPRPHTEPRPTTWQTLGGQPVPVLGHGERFTDLHSGEPHISFGRTVRGLITGRWDHCEVERMALGSNSASGAQYLVPEVLGAQLIDLARARSVLVQAGAQTIDMTSDRMTIAKVAADPAVSTKVENDSFTEDSALAFGSLGFTAHTIGTLIYASRELAEDAPNFPTLIEDVVTRALAIELDRLGLVGVPGTEPRGIVSQPNVGSTGSVGAISWEEVHAAYVGVQAANGTPNAFVAHPTIQGDLDILTSGDGTNSAKLWLGPPPGVDQLQRLSTTNITTAYGIVGDFTQLLIGLRQRPMVEISTEAGDAFKKHQVAVKVTWRGDFGLAQPTHFHVLSGITT